MSRFYFFLMSDDLQFGVKSCEIMCSLGSDHSSAILKSHSNQEDDKGEGYWQFNSSS